MKITDINKEWTNEINVIEKEYEDALYKLQYAKQVIIKAISKRYISMLIEAGDNTYGKQ